MVHYYYNIRKENSQIYLKDRFKFSIFQGFLILIFKEFIIEHLEVSFQR